MSNSTISVSVQTSAAFGVSVQQSAAMGLLTAQAGPQGIQGPPGQQGIQGLPGSAVGSYRHIQAVPSATWTIVHNLGKRPSVTVLDSSNRVCYGEAVYPDTTTVVLTFSAAFSGEAECN